MKLLGEVCWEVGGGEGGGQGGGGGEQDLV